MNNKRCSLCDEKISEKNDGFSNLLDNEEKKRLLKLNKQQTVCTDCKFTLMAVSIISPFF